MSPARPAVPLKQSIPVCLGEKAVDLGTLVFESAGSRVAASFAYAQRWLDSPDRFALSPDLPLYSGFQFRSRSQAAPHAAPFWGCIADAAPDGWGKKVIQRDYAKQRHEALSALPDTLTEFDYLLWVSDFSRVGAIRFRDANGVFQRPDDAKRGTPPLIQLPALLAASRAVEEHRETRRDLDFLRGNGTSLGGLRPKCSILDRDGTLAIGKFPSVADDRAVVHAEVLALRLARNAGITVPDARVVDSQGIPVAVITRFDRVKSGGRLMYLSARSLLGLDEGAQASYVDIAESIRQHGSQAATDLEELWRRMLFNIAINNIDDHLNNHGFLHAGYGKWKLAPAFDINPFPGKARSLKTWITPESGDEASVAAAIDAASYFGLTKDRATAIKKKIVTTVANWRAVAAKVGMSAAAQRQFDEAFSHPELIPKKIRAGVAKSKPR